MALDASQAQFVNAWASYAQAAQTSTGVPWQTILAQWANETGWGTSSAFLDGHNFAGVSPGGVVASYPDYTTGLAAYVQTLTSPLYAGVRNAAAQGPAAAAVALGQSPWAQSGYEDSANDGPGTALLQIMQEMGTDTGDATLTAYVPGTHLHIPGTGAGSSLVPSYISGPISSTASDIANAVVSTIVAAVEKPAIAALFLILAGGLVAAGVWSAASPHVKPAISAAGQKAEQAGAVAAVAA